MSSSGASRAHAALSSVTADQHHKRTEAKNTDGSSGIRSVTWTTAFASEPVVTVGHMEPGGGVQASCQVTARSTTGASVQARNVLTQGAVATVMQVHAQEAT